MSCFDDKIYILGDGINSLAYFHKDIRGQQNWEKSIKSMKPIESVKLIKLIKSIQFLKLIKSNQ